MNRWVVYTRERSPLLVFGILSLGVSLSSAAFTGKIAFSLLPTLVVFIAVFLLLYELRLMDEVKDIEKDKLVYPERPLPRGLIGLQEVQSVIRLLMGFMILFCLFVYFSTNSIAAVSYLFVLSISWLMYKEFYLPEVLRKSPLVATLTHQIIMIPLFVFSVACFDPRQALSKEAIAFAFFNMGAFLSFEVARKLNPNLPPASQHYAVVYGAKVSALFGAFALLISFLGSQFIALIYWIRPFEGVLLLSLAFYIFQQKYFKLIEILFTLSLLLHLYAVWGSSLIGRSKMAKFTVFAGDNVTIERCGGKSFNMDRLGKWNIPVPVWFCVNVTAYEEFLRFNGIKQDLLMQRPFEEIYSQGKMPEGFLQELEESLKIAGLLGEWVAVRSSAIEEDSATTSFAGQFSSFLYQRGLEQISLAIKMCWASAFSQRAIAYRAAQGIDPSLDRIKMGVIVQKMVNAKTSGVAFSRNPINSLDRDHLHVSAVYGLGEGLVGGGLEADEYHIARSTLKFDIKISEKSHAFVWAKNGGIEKIAVELDLRNRPALTDDDLYQVACLAMTLEQKAGCPQDCEWAFEEGRLFCLQTRPITNLPIDRFFDGETNGKKPILWDNSNIIESYSGVTSALTFSHVSIAYKQVYLQTLQIMGVPKNIISELETTCKNLLGLIRGRIYYNLVNWYKLLIQMPGVKNNQRYLETMMGVKQNMNPEFARLLELKPPSYSLFKKSFLLFNMLYNFLTLQRTIHAFKLTFDRYYEENRNKDFTRLNIVELKDLYDFLVERLFKAWKAPILNDIYCMITFGILKNLTEKWISKDGGVDLGSLQNDLLCGEGNLESTKPTKMLLMIASEIRCKEPETATWFVKSKPKDIWIELSTSNRSPLLLSRIRNFLDLYGFRCVNELKLEEPDLHDDPSFLIGAIQSYLNMNSLSQQQMEASEREIRAKAEKVVIREIKGFKRKIYFMVLRQARKVVANRENLRFDRTKIFGVLRKLFRAMGIKLKDLQVLTQPQDVFHLTIEEIASFVDGRAVSIELAKIVEIRKNEYQKYRKTPAPPDRFLTYGAVGASCSYIQVLTDSDLLANEPAQSDDPNFLFGCACCPGIVEGEVRVVHDMSDAEGLSGQILVAARTDPGWVPFYPVCSGLLIERGSLLSHSAVVARELGLPTIVGISGGLMKKLKSGQRVRMDGKKGEIQILGEGVRYDK